MSEIRAIAPIAAWKTKSFWLGLAPAILTGIDVLFQALMGEGGEPIAAAIATLVSLIPGMAVTSDEIVTFMRTIAPLYTLIVFWQRSGLQGGIPRPITLSPTEEKVGVEIVKDTRS